MSEERSRPTPWSAGTYAASESFVSIGEHAAVLAADSQVVALTGPSSEEGSRSDSRLMSAAPDMYYALEGALEAMAASAAGERVPDLSERMADARRALGKARGSDG